MLRIMCGVLCYNLELILYTGQCPATDNELGCVTVRVFLTDGVRVSVTDAYGWR